MKIILEIDGVRHRQVADDPDTSAYCIEDRCSLYQFCQESSVCPCCINDRGGRYFHYEKEVQDES